MTKAQRIKLMGHWWPNACEAQGWPRNDRAFRLEKLSEFVGRPLASASDLNNTSDVDKVKAALLACTDNVAAAIETDDATIGEGRRLRHVIRTEILPCLALYEDAESYMQTVIAGLVRWHKSDRPTREPSLDDLDAVKPVRQTRKSAAFLERASQLEQAMMTLNARLHSKRKAAGQTIHEMKMAARVPCTCLACSRPGVVIELPVTENCPF